MPFGDRKEISAILFYLLERHGPSALASVAADTVDSEPWATATKRWQRHNAATLAASRLMERMGLAYLGRHAQQHPELFNFSIQQPPEFESIDGYDLRLQLPGPPSFTKTAEGVETELRVDGRDRVFVVRHAGRARCGCRSPPRSTVPPATGRAHRSKPCRATC